MGPGFDVPSDTNFVVIACIMVGLGVILFLSSFLRRGYNDFFIVLDFIKQIMYNDMGKICL